MGAPTSRDLEVLVEEQAALRRVAMLAAQGAARDELFAAVVRETRRVLDADSTGLLCFLGDGTARLVAQESRGPKRIPDGVRVPLQSGGLIARVRETGRPASVSSFAGLGDAPAIPADLAHLSAVGAPIAVEGEMWGVLTAAWDHEGETEALRREAARLAQFADLLATAIATVEGREALRRLAAGQAFMRRVATLVAEGRSPQEIFAAVSAQLRDLLGADSMALLRVEADRTATVLASTGSRESAALSGERIEFVNSPVLSDVWESGAPALVDTSRFPEDHPTRRLGLMTLASAPVMVEGRLWGLAVGGWRLEASALPELILSRLAEFCGLIATAIANAESRAELLLLADEQAALHRIATAVAEGQDPAAVFTAVATEACRVLGADASRLVRLSPDARTARVVAECGDLGDRMAVGVEYPTGEETMIARVRTLGQVVRADLANLPEGLLRHRLEMMGLHTAVQAPIVADGRLWGTMAAGWRGERVAPATVEEHLTRFTDAVATAVASAASRDAVRSLATEQAALRRVATLVARGAPPAEVFQSVARGTREVMGVDASILLRYGAGESATVVALDASIPLAVAVGDVLELEPASVSTAVRRTGRPARTDRYADLVGHGAEIVRAAGLRASVGAPVTVEGALWGVVVVTWADERRPPPNAEARLAEFTALTGTAVANGDSRAELAASRVRLVVAADEARRRVQRDLHDGAQQRLVSLALEARAAQHALRTAGAADPAAVDALLDRLVHGMDDAGRQLQHIARGLHPAGLERGGLEPALRALARQSAVPVELSFDLEARLSESLEVASYYVVSEALTNATKHAAASHVAVAVCGREGGLALTVTDDGVGGADPHAGTGLLGLRDRIEALGGRLEIDSPRRRGTRLTMTVGRDTS